MHFLIDVLPIKLVLLELVQVNVVLIPTSCHCSHVLCSSNIYFVFWCFEVLIARSMHHNSIQNLYLQIFTFFSGISLPRVLQTVTQNDDAS
jgi:hypothetical protein